MVSDVGAVFDAYPPALRTGLLELRRLILETAAGADVGTHLLFTCSLKRGPAAGSDVDFERANVRVATFVWMTIIGT